MSLRAGALRCRRAHGAAGLVSRRLRGHHEQWHGCALGPDRPHFPHHRSLSAHCGQGPCHLVVLHTAAASRRHQLRQGDLPPLHLPPPLTPLAMTNFLPNVFPVIVRASSCRSVTVVHTHLQRPLPHGFCCATLSIPASSRLWLCFGTHLMYFAGGAALAELSRQAHLPLAAV